MFEKETSENMELEVTTLLAIQNKKIKNCARNRKRSAIELSIEHPVLLNSVNQAQIFCERL